MKFFDFIKIVRNSSAALKFAFTKKLLGRSFNCPNRRCRSRVGLRSDRGCLDGFIWRCRKCGRSKSCRFRSFFEHSHLSMRQLLALLYMFTNQLPVGHAGNLLGLSTRTTIDWYQYFRNICSWALMQPDVCQPKFGGIDCIIEIDESVISKRKFNVGRLVRERWVFVIYDPRSKIGFQQFVDRRDHETLMEIIHEKIKPGTTIWSDQWGAYNWIANRPPYPSPYQHVTVNHQTNFVDPITGTTTNHVEAMWKRAKFSFKATIGTQDEWVAAHLDEFLWRQRFGEDSFENLIHQFSLKYNI